MFGVDKWLETQNNKIAMRYKADICKLEALFRNDAKQQVELKGSEIEVRV